MGRKVKISSSTLNLWSMDFQGNMEKIIESEKVTNKSLNLC